MAKREKDAPPAPPPGPFNAAFAALAGRLPAAAPDPARPPAAPAGSAPGVAANAAAPTREPPPAPPPRPGPARAVVRMERSGRGGKVVTVVEKLGLRPRDLEAWLSDLKRSLGCGGVIEGDALVLQGDNRERIGRLLEARGVRKVTVA
ncbi:MAG: translation initiation factor [Anaeromyxobacter sp.]|nr:translation initiation factor [Anaeromyxobacter sp.]MBL0275620.1 translation initiation factor [Anaeromyxobacter sp.]